MFGRRMDNSGVGLRLGAIDNLTPPVDRGDAACFFAPELR